MPYAAPSPFSGVLSNGNFLEDYWNAEPAAAYSQWSQGQGNQSNIFSDWLRGQYGQYQNKYMAASPSNPNQGWMDYLKGQNPTTEYQGLSASERGETPRKYAPNVRWIGF